jgi:hypothetical protein
MKNNIFLSILMLVGLFGFAQNTSFLKVINNANSDEAVASFQNSNSDYFLLANTTSGGQGGSDYQLTKTDGLGNTLWSYTYGLSGDDVALNMKSTSDGGAVICGYTTSAITNEDGFISKVSSTGVLEWTRSVITDSMERVVDVVQTKLGGYYATGYVLQDTMDENVLAMMLTSSGAVNWIRTIGGDGDDRGYSVIEGSNDNIFIAGSTSNDSVTMGGIGDTDAYLVSLDIFGNLIRARNLGSSVYEDASQIIETGTNELSIAGRMFNPSSVNNDVYVYRVDTNFNSLGGNYYGTSGDDVLLDLKEGPGASLLLAVGSVLPTSPGDVLLFEVSPMIGAGQATVIGGNMIDGSFGANITGTPTLGYSVFSSGTSYGATLSEDLYLAKLLPNFTLDCLVGTEPIDFGPISLTTDTFENITSSFSQSASVLTRASITNSDSTLCCSLEARTISDTLSLCAGTSINIGRSTISGYVYTWTSIAGSAYTSSSANPSVSPSVSTTYKLVVSSADGKCTPDSATVRINVSQRMTQLPLIDTFFCGGNSVTLNAQSGMIFYEWKNRVATFSGAARLVSSSDTLSLRMIDVNGCFYTDTVIVEEKNLPVFDLGMDTTICDNVSITFNGPSDMASYSWNAGSSTNQSFTTTVSQIHSLLVMDTFGCQFYDEIQVLTKPSSTISIGADTTICEGESYTFFGPSFFTGYIWNGASVANPEFMRSVSGEVTVQANNSFGCPAYDTAVLTVSALPEFSLGSDTGFCDEVDFTLLGPAGMSYTWFNGSTDRLYQAKGAGLFYLIVEDMFGCEYTDSIVLEEYTSPIITLGNDTSLRSFDPLVLSPGSGFDLYSWSTGESTESISVTDKGSYSVTVTDENGCTGNAEMKVLSTASLASIEGITYKVYPNPTTDMFTFTSSEPLQGAVLSVVDGNGKIVMKRSLDGNAISVSVADLPSGLYKLLLNDDTSIITFSVLVK